MSHYRQFSVGAAVGTALLAILASSPAGAASSPRIPTSQVRTVTTSMWLVSKLGIHPDGRGPPRFSP
jgi:hypothetical protein